MTPRRRCLLPRCVIGAVLLLLLVQFPAPAFDDLDDLFSDPESGIVEDEIVEEEEDAPPPQVVDVAALTTSPVRFSGSVDTGAGLALGLSEWLGSSAAGGASGRELLNYGAGYDMKATFRVTARPQPYLRFTSSFTTELREQTATFSPLSIGDLFVDYTLQDRIFIRAGKFGQTWGQARILENIGNIAGDTDSGAAMRATVPLRRGTATALVYTLGPRAPYSASDPRSFIYAGQFETTRGRVSSGVAARARSQDVLRTTAHVTLGLGHLDLTQEALFLIDREDPLNPDATTIKTLSQFVWEGGYPVWRVIGEYLFDTGVPDWQGSRMALGVRMPRFLPGGWRPNVQWRHAFVDNSGQIETALTGDLAPSMEGSIGIPVIYGPPGSVYRGIDTTIPSNGVVSVGFGARLKFSF